MSWGAEPHLLDSAEDDPDGQLAGAIEHAVQSGAVRSGDLVVLLFGSGEFQGRAADTVRLLRIP
jgi:pyruvate kinase